MINRHLIRFVHQNINDEMNERSEKERNVKDRTATVEPHSIWNKNNTYV